MCCHGVAGTGMRERFADKRVGYKVVSFWDYSQNPYRAVRDSIIQKWNLGIAEKDRKKYRRGEPVEPLNPIVFRVDTCFPAEFVPYIKEGILAWNTAFERAGVQACFAGEDGRCKNMFS